MVRADFEPFFEALRDLMLDIWGVNLIQESGDEVRQLDPATQPYPWGIIELGEEVNGARGPAAMDITWSFPIYLWLVMGKTSGEADLETFRGMLSDMECKVWRDPHICRTVNNIEPGPINWTGRGRQWPCQTVEGEIAMAGYCGFTFQLIESRVQSR